MYIDDSDTCTWFFATTGQVGVECTKDFPIQNAGEYVQKFIFCPYCQHRINRKELKVSLWDGSVVDGDIVTGW